MRGTDIALRSAVLQTGGVQAARIAALFSVFLSVAVIVWTGVALVLAVGWWRRRRTDSKPDKNGRVEKVVTIASVATVLTLLGLLVASIGTGRAIAAESAATGRTIRVVGHKWWWEFRYDPTLPTQVTTANELHLPVGVPVTLELESNDVIHSFWVPALNGKRDLIPGRPAKLWLRADAAGVYQGRCAEFCGLQHANMAFTVVAEPRATFDAWLAAAAQPGAAPDTPQRALGQRVFLGTRCALCHTISGTEARGTVGPDLTHVASRPRLGAGAVPNAPGHLAGWVVDSQALKPGNQMPPNPLPPSELEPLLDYLGSLR
jgi:cytochrome c oxidase subunit 2